MESINNDDIVLNKFKIALEGYGISIDSIDDTGLIYISRGDTTLKVSLDNVRRGFERDRDESHISDLVRAIVNYTIELPDNWEDAKDDIFVAITPSDREFANFVHIPLTDMCHKVYTYYNGNNFSWISAEDLSKWGISQEELSDQADKNIDRLAETASITVDEIHGRKLVFIETEYVSLKASMLFSLKMKNKINSELGLPFYAVIPVRDFCYIFSQSDFDFFSARLGSTVVKEYQNSGYPITTEILKFTDEGVSAMGNYPVD